MMHQCTLEDRELKLGTLLETKGGFCSWLQQTSRHLPSLPRMSQAWLQSRFGNYIRLHGVWWGVTMGLKLLFHLTLCNLLRSHQCWHHQTSELLHIIKFRHWDGYFSRFAEQETVSGDLITIHHMLSLTDTEIYSEKDLDTKHSGHWPHRSSHKQTGVWIIPSPQHW